jgi:LmbE family N-acetylglucosaminyl deacetylase
MPPKNVLCLVPHGDDEVLSAGATISKHKRNGDSVTVCFLKGDKTERNLKQIEQSKLVAKFLNIDSIHHLDLLHTDDLGFISNKIEKFLSNKKFDCLYTIYENDNHQEHRLAFDAISIAVRSHGPCSIPVILSGETLSSTVPRLTVSSKFNPTYYNIVSKQDVDNKIRALSFYTDEIHSFPHPRSQRVIQALAELRGSECGNEYAEAFVPVRYFNFK